jgi:hypothetical protein
MSVFRKIANATASVKPESTKESLAIEEELEVRRIFDLSPQRLRLDQKTTLADLTQICTPSQKIEGVDKFVHGFFETVQRKVQTAQGTLAKRNRPLGWVGFFCFWVLGGFEPATPTKHVKKVGISNLAAKLCRCSRYRY